MRVRTGLALLALLCGVATGADATQPAKEVWTLDQAKRPVGEVSKIAVSLPSGWYLHVYPDGSGRLGYGSNDDVDLAAGSFDFAAMFKKIAAAALKADGTMASDVMVAFAVQGAERVHGAYTGDAGLVRDYFAKALALVPKEGNRLAELWVKVPPFDAAGK